jgi:hypothetical protein
VGGDDDRDDAAVCHAGRPDPGKDAVSRVRNHAIVVLPGFPKEFL